MSDAHPRFAIRSSGVMVVVLLTTACFAVQILLGNPFSPGGRCAFAMLSCQPVLEGEFWRLATYLFLHLGWIHFGGNLLGLIAFGPMLEDILGPRRFIAFYLACGVLAGGATVVAVALGCPHVHANPVAGASGALTGVATALALLDRDLAFELIGFRVPLRWIIGAYCLWSILSLGFDFHAAGEATHLAGAGVGLALGAAILWRRKAVAKIMDFRNAS